MDSNKNSVQKDAFIAEQASSEENDKNKLKKEDGTVEQASNEEDYKWYALKVKSGSERTIAERLKKNDVYKGFFKDIYNPTPEITSADKKKVKTKKILSGYLFVKMIYKESLLKRLTLLKDQYGFLNVNGNPKVFEDAELDNLKMNIEAKGEELSDIRLEVGDEVKIQEGPFATFLGVIEEIDMAKNIVKVRITIFGRDVPVSLELQQIKRNS